MAVHEAARRGCGTPGSLTVGIPNTVAPPPVAHAGGRPASAARTACREHGPPARGISRPRVALADPWWTLWASLGAVAARVTTSGIAAQSVHGWQDAATLSKAPKHASRLSKRARTFRRRLRLRCRQVTHCKASINEWSLSIRLQVSENHALRHPLSLPFGPRPAVAVPGKTEAFQISGTTELNKSVFLGNDSDTATIDRRGGELHGAGQGRERVTPHFWRVM